MSLSLTPLPGIPLVKKGDDLFEIVLKGLEEGKIKLQDRDILVLAQKIVSKAEGRLVDLNTITPSIHAQGLAEFLNKDPRLVEVILSESTQIIKMRKKSEDKDASGLIILRHRLGFISANAGVDQSNVGENPNYALLLPKDPDASCLKLHKRIKEKLNIHVGIIINDSHGRPFRSGTVGVALGIAGIAAVESMIGKPDLFNKKLRSTVVGAADQLASAASLLMGQADEGQPIIHIRGYSFIPTASSNYQELLIPPPLDLFI